MSDNKAKSALSLLRQQLTDLTSLVKEYEDSAGCRTKQEFADDFGFDLPVALEILEEFGQIVGYDALNKPKFEGYRCFSCKAETAKEDEHCPECDVCLHDPCPTCDQED